MSVEEVKNNKNNMVSSKRLLKFMMGHKFWLTICILTSIISVAITLYLGSIMNNIVNLISKIGSGDSSQTLGLMLSIIILGVLAKYFMRYSAGRFSAATIYDIRRKLSEHIIKLKASYMEDHHTGELVSRLTNDTMAVQMFLQVESFNVLYFPLIFIGSLTYMAILNWKLFLVSVVTMPIMMVVSGLISKPVEKYAGELMEQYGESNAAAQDAVMGYNVVKAFNLNNEMVSKYKEIMDRLLKKYLQLEKRSALIMPATMLLQIAPLVASVAYGGYLIVQGKMGAGVLVAFIYLFSILNEVTSGAPNTIMEAQKALGAAGHLFDILDEPSEDMDKGIRVEIKDQVPVQFEDVFFSYNHDKKILDGISFSIHKGKTVALVGSSGGGKSTLIKLLTGFYKPTEGKIRLFGHDLENVNLENSREQISLVSQEAYLFPGSISENISYGKPDATIDEIYLAAKAANAHEFIVDLPQGYNTEVGERGARLSGGQKQRISLARAILKNAPVLLLDEPTSALDTHSEAMIQNTLESLMEEKTMLVIAHRLSTIKNADQVLVLDKGKIVDRGTHKELLEKSGVYRELYMKQFENLPVA